MKYDANYWLASKNQQMSYHFFWWIFVAPIVFSVFLHAEKWWFATTLFLFVMAFLYYFYSKMVMVFLRCVREKYPEKFAGIFFISIVLPVLVFCGAEISFVYGIQAIPVLLILVGFVISNKFSKLVINEFPSCIQSVKK